MIPHGWGRTGPAAGVGGRYAWPTLMRLALCTQAAPWEGQPRSGLYNLRPAAALCELGHVCEIFVLSMWGPAWAGALVPKLREFNARPDEYVYQGVKFHTVRGVLPHPNVVRWKLAPRWPGAAGWIFDRAFRKGLMERLGAFGPDAVLYHDGVSLGRLGASVHRAMGTRWGVIEQDALEPAKASALGREYAVNLRTTTSVWYLAERYARHAREQLGLHQARVMFNGTQFPTREQLSAPRPERWKGRRIILCVGTYVARKGHEVLVRAFARAGIEDGLLLIVGKPPPGPLESLVRELGLEGRVEFLDYVSQEEIPQYMVWADVFALTSWDEPFGMVYVEAMAAGRPVVMCEDCGLAPFIERGVHGWVVPVRHVEATAAALHDAFSPGRNLAEMGSRARSLVEGRFTWQNSARQVLTGLGHPERAG